MVGTGGADGWEFVGHSVLFSVAAWCWVYGLTGAAVRWLKRERPWVRYLADSSYWLYLMHFTETARRAQIVSAAVDILAEDGFRAASLARIAQRAGISKGLILYHFSSKEELLRQTLVDTVRGLAAGATEGVDLSASPTLVLREIVRSSARVGIERARERRAIRQIVVNLGEGEDAVGPQAGAPLIDAVERIYVAGQRAGEFRQDFDTHVMAITHQAAVDAMYVHFDATPDTEPQAHADALADLLLAAVTTPQRVPSGAEAGGPPGSSSGT